MKKDSITIAEVLSRHVEQILPDRRGLEALLKKRKIRLYLGVDPTAPHLHLGHAVVLRKLREFQTLGHHVVLLFGTFTGLIGDPSGRDKAREPLPPQEIKRNMQTYQEQAGKILDLKKLTIKSNGVWLSKLKPEEFLRLSSFVTVQQLLERDMFQKRMRGGREVWLNELFYPLLQGYDSVAMDVDLEIGGTDQTFNMLMGRRLQKAYRKKEKFILTVPLLLGLDGRKMSKSHNNAVNIADPPEEMYGKLMSMKDDLIPQYVELCTEFPPREFTGLPWRDAKAKLAKGIVGLYHGSAAARRAEEQFERVFLAKQAPEGVPVITGLRGSLPLVDLVTKVGFAASKSEARRLVVQGGVRVDGEAKKDPELRVRLQKGSLLQAGKRRFVRIG